MDYAEYKGRVLAEKLEGAAEYNQLAPRFEAIRVEIACRKEVGLSQKELAERMGTTQAIISRFESGNYNPSLDLLQRMATCMGKQLHISFE